MPPPKEGDTVVLQKTGNRIKSYSTGVNLLAYNEINLKGSVVKIFAGKFLLNERVLRLKTFIQDFLLSYWFKPLKAMIENFDLIGG